MIWLQKLIDRFTVPLIIALSIAPRRNIADMAELKIASIEYSSIAFQLSIHQSRFHWTLPLVISVARHIRLILFPYNISLFHEKFSSDVFIIQYFNNKITIIFRTPHHIILLLFCLECFYRFERMYKPNNTAKCLIQFVAYYKFELRVIPELSAFLQKAHWNRSIRHKLRGYKQLDRQAH